MTEQVEVDLVLPVDLNRAAVDEAMLAGAMELALPTGRFPDFSGRAAQCWGEPAGRPGTLRWTASFDLL